MPPTTIMDFSKVQPNAQDLSNADRVAATLLRDEPALKTSLDFGGFVKQGEGTGPRVLIGDQSEIPLLSPPTPPVLDHRMALLARDGDLVILRAPDPVFFDYIRTTLNRPGVTSLAAGIIARDPVARLCRTTPALSTALQEFVNHSGGATLQSYMTTGNTWRLAQSLGEATGHVVHVAGPGPRIARRANDKLWFAALARRVLGTKSVPPTLSAFGPAAAAGLVRRLARTCDQIVIKVPNSAGSAGNIRLDSPRFAELPLRLIARFLQRQLAAIGWRGRYPLLVGVWDSNVTCSPSVQMRLPHPDSGPPRVDGIFEQHVHGSNAAFVGGARSTLPVAIQMRLTHEALRVAAVLQRVGYYGRCSFDAVLVRTETGELQPHWIECNGRWGGVSIPMAAAQSLAGGSAPDGLVVLQSSLVDQVLTTADLLAELDRLLLRPGISDDGMVIVAPPQTAADRQVTLMSMAHDQTTAETLMETAVDRLSQ